MKYLLDINVLLAAIWKNHSQHSKAFGWLADKEVVLCPLTELGFVRISTNPKAINASVEKSREALSRFLQERKAVQIADDLPPLESHPKTSAQVTDCYLASLAERHGFTLATLDAGIKHPAAEIVK